MRSTLAHTVAAAATRAAKLAGPGLVSRTSFVERCFSSAAAGRSHALMNQRSFCQQTRPLSGMPDSAPKFEIKSKVYVGNLNWKMTKNDLLQYFSQFGQVQDAIIIQDRETGRSRGFGFVTFMTEGEAEKAAKGANQQEFQGRMLKVNVAENKPRSERPQYRDN